MYLISKRIGPGKGILKSGVRKVIYDSSPKTSFPNQKEGRRRRGRIRKREGGGGEKGKKS